KYQQNGVYSTRCSQAVTHPSTNRARRCLTSVIGRELVLSTWYGRRHHIEIFLAGLSRKTGENTSKMESPAQKGVYSSRCSQAVTHPSTNRARRCLTSVIGRELVLSTWYGRRHYIEIFLAGLSRKTGENTSKMESPAQKGVYSTRCSQAVTHPSTNRARRCLTSVIGRELVPFNVVWP
ncbi:hypothetical protein LOTGIDRAFT_132613, partial [Lottia gigantea]